MATCTRTVWKVLAGCQRQLLSASSPTYTGVSQTAWRNLPIRTFAVKIRWRDRKNEKDQKEDTQKDVKKEKKIVDDRQKSSGRPAQTRTPVDDVYLLRFYSRTIYSAADAIDLLKKYQVLDFTDPSQPLYIDLKLDMLLEKKKKIEPFFSTLRFPYVFMKELNKVLVFTEAPDQARVARENGAALVGGEELVEPILNDEISADYYIAAPDIVPKLLPLKNKLRKKFPKSSRGSVGIDIAKMLELFKVGRDYSVESDRYVKTQIATLDMPKEHILANLQAILMDVCSRRPASKGPFIERAIMASHTSEALWFNSEDMLLKPEE